MNLWTGFNLLTKWSSLNQMVDCAVFTVMTMNEQKIGANFLNMSMLQGQ